MRKLLELLTIGIGSGVMFALANWRALSLVYGGFPWILILIICYIWLMITPSMANRRLFTKKLRCLADGRDLLIMFLLSATISVVWNLMGIFGHLAEQGYPAWRPVIKF